MSSERIEQIEALYHAAREATAGERRTLLGQADPELRREVELLLSARKRGEFLDRLPFHHAVGLVNDSVPALPAAGARLGPYCIEAKLGGGGMGEVFRAVDTRLGRAVAIKVAHEEFSTRFEREARAIAALNHPNICTLHDVGPNYLVMELVEGETLASRLEKGPLPAELALQYATQIVAALTEAHGRGIVHRDLKPGNIMLTRTGVKVLDFGLAMLDGDAALTAERMVMGTPGYMAPEQRDGKSTDARTDIYAFGCVLYEMLTGARLAVERRPISPRKLKEVVSRCLENDPAARWQSAAELQEQLAAITPARRGTRVAAIAAVVMLALSGAAAYVHRNNAPKLTGNDTLVLADFTNTTGDPVFDDTLREGLLVQLQQSPFLTLISDERIRKTLALMNEPPDRHLVPNIARGVCVRTASAAVLEGSIASLGSEYVVSLRAKNCTTGDILDDEQAQAARKEDVLGALSQIASRFRTRVGESLATVQKHSIPLAEATTSSLEALKAYSTAMKADVSSGHAAAIPFFSRAVEIDPEFAMAYANLGLAYSSIGESALSVENTTKAWQLRDRVSDHERYFVDFSYDREVTGNLEKAFHTLELWIQTYPRSEQPSPQRLLGGLAAQGTGRFDTAIDASSKEIAVDPDFILAYENLASGYYFLDRFDEAENTLLRAAERKLEDPYLLLIGYNIAVVTDNKGQMDRIVAAAKGKHEAEHSIAHATALGLVRSGRLLEGRQSSGRAVDLALQEGEREVSASYEAARAVWEALCGNPAAGKRTAIAALDLSTGRDVQYLAGLALAFSGDAARSEALAGDLEARFPEDTVVKFTYAPVLRALAALGRGKPADSVQHLQIALPYELAANGLNFNHFYLGGLHSAYVRGEALIGLHRYAEAAREFQKILEHRGIVGPDPIGALAHLQLARAFGLSGDNVRAKAAYEDFLTLWKNADPDIPILKDARAEYAMLH